MSMRILIVALATCVSLGRAELPYVPDVFNEIEIVAYGTLVRPTHNAFSAWVSALPLSGNRTNFRVGRDNPIGYIFVTRILGFDETCVVANGMRLDVCATKIERPSNENITLNVYTQVKKSDGSVVATPLTDEIITQNIMIRAIGKVFGMSWDYTNSSSVMWAMPLNGDWGITNAVMFPSIEDANLVRGKYFSSNGYASYPDGVSLSPLALMEYKDASGKLVSGGYTKGVIGKTLGGSLKQLRWIVSSAVPSVTGNVQNQGVVNQVYSNTRVAQPGGLPSCYTLSGTNVFNVTGKQGNMLDYSDAINAGAVMTEMILESLTKYDIFTSSHPGGYVCLRPAGAGLDMWSETYW